MTEERPMEQVAPMKPTTEPQESESITRHADVSAAALNTIHRIVGDILDHGVPSYMTPGLVAPFAQASAEVISGLVRDED
jgi:hypothetical protein